MTLRNLVRAAAANYPYLAAKYRDLKLDTDFDFTEVPAMTREDVTALAEQVPGRGRPTGAFLFTSGGSTAAPKMAWIPCEMHLGGLLPYWRPLGPSDVLANLAMPGRLWSAHYFYNRLAEHLGADVIGLGGLPEHDTPQWMDLLHRFGTTAIAGTPSQIGAVLRSGHPLVGQLRAAIWFGEPCDAEVQAAREYHAPHLGLWGNYGSTETWVIGYNTPTCPADVFHVLPYQQVEIVDGAVLVTTTHPGAVSPVIRYRIGDAAEFTRCPCERGGPTLRLAGREDSLVKFAGTLVSPQELVTVARSAPGVRAAQVALIQDPAGEAMEVRVVGPVGPDELRERLLDSQIDLRFALRGDEQSFRVRVMPALGTSPQTGKTPALIREGTA